MVAIGAEQRENRLEQRSKMTDVKPAEDRDWIVPGVLVGVIVILAVIVVVALATQTSDADDDTIAGQLETWTSCLRAEGANVPLVETLRGGGFRITVDGSFVEEGIDEATLRPALDACEEKAPEGVQRMMTLIDGFSEFPFGSFEMFEEFEGFERFGGFDDFEVPGDSREPRVPRISRELERFDLAEICEMIDSGDIDPAVLPRRLQRACL
jgi:hypothetical protein